MSCYCRGFGTCDTCEQHVCTGDCTCGTDPTPNTREAVTSGYVNPTQARTEAWQQKQEATR